MSIDEKALHSALKTYMKLSFNEDTTQRTVVVFDVLKQVIEAYESAKASEPEERGAENATVAQETAASHTEQPQIRSVGLTDGQCEEEAKELGVRVPGAAPKYQPDDCLAAFEKWSNEQGWETQGFPDARQRWAVWKAAWAARLKTPEESCS